MAKLNQTQRNYFQNRVASLQSEKLSKFTVELQATLPDLDLTVPQISLESVRAGRYRIKTSEEMFTGHAPGNFYNNSQYVNNIYVPVISDAAAAAKIVYDTKITAFKKIQAQQALKFTDTIMLGGDDAALSALAALETEEIVVPD